MDFSFLDDDDDAYELGQFSGPSDYTNSNRPTQATTTSSSSSSLGVQNLAMIDSLDLPIGTMADPTIQKLFEMAKNISECYSVICQPQMSGDKESVRIYLRGNSTVNLTEVKLAIFSWFKQNSYNGFVPTKPAPVPTSPTPATSTTHADIVANLLRKNLGGVVEPPQNFKSSSAAAYANGHQKMKSPPRTITRIPYNHPPWAMAKSKQAQRREQARYDNKWRQRFKPSHKMSQEELDCLATTQWMWPTSNNSKGDYYDDESGQSDNWQQTEHRPNGYDEWPTPQQQKMPNQVNFGPNHHHHQYQQLMESERISRPPQNNNRRHPLGRQYYNSVPPPPSLSGGGGAGGHIERVRRPSPHFDDLERPPERLMRLRYIRDSQSSEQPLGQFQNNSDTSQEVLRIPRDRLSSSIAINSQPISHVSDDHHLPWSRSTESRDFHFPLPSSSSTNMQDDEYWA